MNRTTQNQATMNTRASQTPQTPHASPQASHTPQALSPTATQASHTNPQTPSPTYLLEMRHITKDFPGVRALDDVNFQVRQGDIHCLVGENGAGKSTLMKILSGVHSHGNYDGDIVFRGEVQRFTNVRHSEAAGIGIIYQEISLIPELSIYENLFFGHERTKNLSFLVDWTETKTQAQALLDRVHLDVDLNMKVKYLGVGQQQLIQIAKSLSQDSKLLILDEPTAALNDVDVANLLSLLRELRDDGVTCIMISHKLDEVLDIADAITVLRDGRSVADFDVRVKKPDAQTLIQNMVGREILDIYGTRDAHIESEVLLELRHWSVRHPQTGRELLTDINLELRRGEVVGLAGLVGAGRTELALSIFGNTPHYNIDPDSELYLYGEKTRFNSPQQAIRKGLAYVTEDRKATGLVLIQSVRFNTSFAKLERISRAGVVDQASEIQQTFEVTREMNVKTPSIEQVCNNLSGGNQQKVVLSKWLFTDPEILILDEPTRGIDVGAKEEIYTLINQMVEDGKTILMISSELPEILGLCDRVYVISEGYLTGELSREEATEVRVMEYATMTRRSLAKNGRSNSTQNNSNPELQTQTKV